MSEPFFFACSHDDSREVPSAAFFSSFKSCSDFLKLYLTGCPEMTAGEDVEALPFPVVASLLRRLAYKEGGILTAWILL